jgi:hypothetical protein
MKSYNMNFKPRLIFSVLLMIIFIVGCSGSTEITSTYNDNQIVVDGSYKDWGKNINYVKDDNIAFGFKNDKDNLYIVIVTSDRSKIMKILLGGLTTWIESDKDKIGIEFPLKPDPGEMQGIPTKQTDQEGQFEAGSRIKNLISKNNRLQILGKNNQLLYSGSAELGPDFFGKLSFDANQIVDEMKIPISGNDLAEKLFGKNVSKVEITFTTGEIDRNEDKENRHSNLMTEDEGFQSNQEVRGNDRRYGSRGKNNDTNPLEYKFNVTLSK